MSPESEEVVNHFVTISKEQFQALALLKAESGCRTWKEFYAKLHKAKEQNLVNIRWSKIR
jgi:hypothetical protein